jgi:hypothetical protein
MGLVWEDYGKRRNPPTSAKTASTIFFLRHGCGDSRFGLCAVAMKEK